MKKTIVGLVIGLVAVVVLITLFIAWKPTVVEPPVELPLELIEELKDFQARIGKAGEETFFATEATLWFLREKKEIDETTYLELEAKLRELLEDEGRLTIERFMAGEITLEQTESEIRVIEDELKEILASYVTPARFEELKHFQAKIQEIEDHILLARETLWLLKSREEIDETTYLEIEVKLPEELPEAEVRLVAERFMAGEIDLKQAEAELDLIKNRLKEPLAPYVTVELFEELNEARVKILKVGEEVLLVSEVLRLLKNREQIDEATYQRLEANLTELLEDKTRFIIERFLASEITLEQVKTEIDIILEEIAKIWYR